MYNLYYCSAYSERGIVLPPNRTQTDITIIELGFINTPSYVKEMLPPSNLK